MRSVVGVVLALLLVSGAASAQQNQPLPGVRMTNLDGRAVRVQAIGLEDRRPGAPVVVFEAGATNSLEVWGGIPYLVATMAPVVAYDRAGLGSSEWDEANPTPRHVAGRLRQVLRQIGADPPFVLVGFSWGGMLVRYFASYYPSEVVALVLVDPSPMVTESLASNLAPRIYLRAIGEPPVLPTHFHGRPTIHPSPQRSLDGMRALLCPVYVEGAFAARQNR